MSDFTPYVGICYEDTPKVLRSYVDNIDEEAIDQASTDEVNYLVKQYDSKSKAEDDIDGTTIQAEATAGSVADLIFDTLQTWRLDDRGFNFQMTLPAASFPTKGKWYVVEVWVTPQAGEDFQAGIWILECLPTRRD